MFENFSKAWYPISLTIVWGIQPVCEHFFRDFNNLGLIKVAVLLVTLIIICFTNTLLKRKYKQKHDYDYKIFFPAGDVVCQDFFTKMRARCTDNASGIEFITDMNIFNKSEQLLTHEALISRPIYKSKKVSTDVSREESKYIVQCLFVPMDKNDNTLLIRRKKENHGSLMYLRNSGNVSFISFSPIPDHYQEKFDPLQAYHREVCKNEKYEYTITPFAACLRKTNGNNYFFLIYLIKYPDVEFLKNGETNTAVIDEIFGTRQADGTLKAGSYFQKDNDLIQRAITFEELKELREFSSSRIIKAIKKGDMRSVFDIDNYSKSVLMGVEKMIVDEILKQREKNI